MRELRDPQPGDYPSPHWGPGYLIAQAIGLAIRLLAIAVLYPRTDSPKAPAGDTHPALVDADTRRNDRGPSPTEADRGSERGRCGAIT